MKNSFLSKHFKFSNVILVIILVLLIMFTIRVLGIIEEIGYEPSTLITAVFGAALGEFGILGWIKNNKIKNNTDCSNDEEGVG